MNYLTVDPFDVTNFNRTEEQLQSFVLFAVCVAGKTAKQISFALDEFLQPAIDAKISPFDLMKKYIKRGVLLDNIKASSLGKHNLLDKFIKQIVSSNLDLRKCSVDDLEKLHGIGPKTARFFILHSRVSQDIAAIDTHVLKHIREVLGHKDVPKTTPSNSKLYKRLETIFIEDAKKHNMSVADYDLQIWKNYARGKQI